MAAAGGGGTLLQTFAGNILNQPGFTQFLSFLHMTGKSRFITKTQILERENEAG